MKFLIQILLCCVLLTSFGYSQCTEDCPTVYGADYCCVQIYTALNVDTSYCHLSYIVPSLSLAYESQDPTAVAMCYDATYVHPYPVWPNAPGTVTPSNPPSTPSTPTVIEEQKQCSSDQQCPYTNQCCVYSQFYGRKSWACSYESSIAGQLAVLRNLDSSARMQCVGADATMIKVFSLVIAGLVLAMFVVV